MNDPKVLTCFRARNDLCSQWCELSRLLSYLVRHKASSTPNFHDDNDDDDRGIDPSHAYTNNAHSLTYYVISDSIPAGKDQKISRLLSQLNN